MTGLPTALFALGWMCLAGAHGQESTSSEAKGWLRFLPVGESPPVRQEVRDGVRHLLPPPPGSVPPRLVQLSGADGSVLAGSVRLKLRMVSQPVLALPGEVPLREVDLQGGVGNARWHSLRMPERPAVLAILWRDPREKNWSKANHLVLADDVKAFPGGTVRFSNVSPFPVGITLGGKKLALPPGETALLGVPNAPMAQTRLTLQVADARGNSRKIFDSGMTQRQDERTNVVIFRADGTQPRNPAKVHIVREKAALPDLPRKR